MLVDPVRAPARLLRRLDPSRRARFCASHLDRAPDDVLIHETRSLCLARPATVEAWWSYDPYNGHYEARMAFRVGDFDTGERGVAVTDLAWRALGRVWLAGGEHLRLGDAALCERVVVLDSGRVCFNGTVRALLQRAEGCVWLADEPHPGAVSTWRTGTGRYRNLADPAPSGAELVEPTLEDAYLLLRSTSPALV